MFTITRSQRAALDQAAFRLYIGRLAGLMSRSLFAAGVRRLELDPNSPDDLRHLARKLVDDARQLGIEAEGDVTPFVLLAVCDDPALSESGLRLWVDAYLEATEYSSEERLDAVYALLPATVRDAVFVDGVRE